MLKINYLSNKPFFLSESSTFFYSFSGIKFLKLLINFFVYFLSYFAIFYLTISFFLSSYFFYLNKNKFLFLFFNNFILSLIILELGLIWCILSKSYLSSIVVFFFFPFSYVIFTISFFFIRVFFLFVNLKNPIF